MLQIPPLDDAAKISNYFSKSKQWNEKLNF